MEIIKYPLLLFPINQQAMLGLLVGTDYQVVEKDERAVKNSLTQYLQKDYKKYDYYPTLEITDPKVKTVEVTVRPSYEKNGVSYPGTQTLKVPITVVYGETESNYHECYLPLLGENFYYYDARQFKSLVAHFASTILNQMTPEQIHQYVLYPKPSLGIIQLRVKNNRDYNWDYSRKRQFKTLNRLAERYPYTKAMRKNVSAFPEAAWELENIVGDVVEKIMSLRANVLIVGHSGVGKSAVLKQAIKKIDNTSRKDNLGYTFWRVLSQRITASAKYLGEWQEAIEEFIDELSAANGILWVLDMIRLLQTGGRGAEDSVAAFLISFLQQGKLQMIGEVTPQELESMRRLLPGFVQNFQIINIEELPEHKIQSILQKASDYAAQNLKVEIAADAQQLAYRLLARYFQYESFPGKGIKFLGQCVSTALFNEKKHISKNDIIDTFIEKTGLPELFLKDNIRLDTIELSQYFNSKIIGQPKAIEKMTGIVKVFKAGLNNPYKPIATLVFAGPTGVGKTASAKALADYFFGKGQKKSPLIRIDMSEFQHPSQINRFIGAGKEVGKLVQDIRERPFSVLLLDEVEKAHPAIFDAFLTVLDEGMLVDAFGRVTNFRNTIIIMTTNLGASNRKSISFVETTSEADNYMSAISRWFRPEFVNRLDGVVMFNSLQAPDIEKITRKELEELSQREGFTKKGLEIDFSENLVKHLARIGFDEKYGARPLQRAIEQSIVSPMATWLLQHPKVKNCTLEVQFLENRLLIQKK